MHTLVTLNDGVLKLVFRGADASEVDQARWRAALAPAIQVLARVGGGALYVPHRPDEISA